MAESHRKRRIMTGYNDVWSMNLLKVDKVDLADKRKELMKLIGYYVSDCRLEITDDIEQWCEKNHLNIPDNVVFTNRIAVAVHSDNCKVILLKRNVSCGEMISIITLLCIRSFNEDVESLLQNPWDFVRHTVLHEIAHLINNWNQSREGDCDKWAFDQLAYITQ